jgi:hypothetical protein
MPAAIAAIPVTTMVPPGALVAAATVQPPQRPVRVLYGVWRN